MRLFGKAVLRKHCRSIAQENEDQERVGGRKSSGVVVTREVIQSVVYPYGVLRASE